MTDAPTQPELVVVRLKRDEIRTLYPVIREAEPSLSLAQWLNYARRVTAGRSARDGILIARRKGIPYSCGAVCYSRERSMNYGAVLVAEHFIAVDLLYPDAVLSALLRELDSVAARLGCTAIRSIVRGRHAALLHDLHSAGHRPDGVTLTKPVPLCPGPASACRASVT